MTTIERGGRRVAALVHDPSLAEEPDTIDLVASAVGLPLENVRLQAELRSQFSFLVTLVNTAPSLFIHLDKEGTIVNQNVGRGRGSRRGRRGGDPRPQVLGRLHRRVGARRRDRALRGSRARPPCRRVREHLRQPPRREPRRVLALRPAPRRARPDQGDHRGRHRHHGAPRGGCGPRARARVPEHDRERGAEPPPADRRARGDRAPRLQQGVRARARGGAARDARHRALGRLRRSGGVGDGAAADQARRGRGVRRRPRQHVGDEERPAPVGALVVHPPAGSRRAAPPPRQRPRRDGAQAARDPAAARARHHEHVDAGDPEHRRRGRPRGEHRRRRRRRRRAPASTTPSARRSAGRTARSCERACST